MKGLFLILSFSLFLFACETGYVQTDEGWTYIIINESGKSIINMDPDLASFKILDKSGYAIDKDKVYHRGYPMENIDPNSIEFFDNSQYLKDVNGVYFQTSKILFANPATFELLDFPYAKDDQWLYNGSVPFQVDSIDQFEVTFSDNIRTYYTLKFFLSQYPSYQWMDTTGIEGVTIMEKARAKTKNESYQGIKKIEQH